MDRALKSNFLTKFAMKSTQQALFDDLFYVNAASFGGVGGGGVASDDFSVDTFLDLSNDDFNDEGFVGEGEGEEQGKGNSSSSNFSGDFDSGSLPAGELSVPVEDIDQLEWLSQFVDDSPSELSLLFPPAGICNEKNGNNGSKLSFERPIKSLAPPQNFPIPQFPSPVPSKPRSKRSRSRPSGQPWSTALLLLRESASSVKPAAKKQRKWQAGEGGGLQSQRRCSHCHVQKTPQWRSGPLGEKTLCNACGVRYKSGRLFPEYRPACSPTFLESVHSNSHRKVLEMRMKKALVGPGSDLTSMVPNLDLHLNRVASF